MGECSSELKSRSYLTNMGICSNPYNKSKHSASKSGKQDVRPVKVQHLAFYFANHGHQINPHLCLSCRLKFERLAKETINRDAEQER